MLIRYLGECSRHFISAQKGGKAVLPSKFTAATRTATTATTTTTTSTYALQRESTSTPSVQYTSTCSLFSCAEKRNMARTHVVHTCPPTRGLSADVHVQQQSKAAAAARVARYKHNLNTCNAERGNELLVHSSIVGICYFTQLIYFRLLLLLITN